MKLSHARLAVSSLALLSSQVLAQPVYQYPPERTLTLEIRSGAVFPTARLATLDLANGYSLGAVAALKVVDRWYVYGAWDLAHVWPETPTPRNESFDDTGMALGLRYEHPFRANSGLAYRLESGITYRKIDTENRDGDLETHGSHGLGREHGAALVIPIPHGLRAISAIRYRRLSRMVEYDGEVHRGVLRYAAWEFGFAGRF